MPGLCWHESNVSFHFVSASVRLLADLIGNRIRLTNSEELLLLKGQKSKTEHVLRDATPFTELGPTLSKIQRSKLVDWPQEGRVITAILGHVRPVRNLHVCKSLIL